jgi:putative CocE/NonD family hydrolase
LIDHPDHDDYWRFSTGQRTTVAGPVTSGRYPNVGVPTLNITGWYDTCLQGVINNFLGMVRYGPEDLRGKHQLIIGPWIHSEPGASTVGDLNFGPEAQVDFLRVELRWFDRWLKGIMNGVDDEPQVNTFLMGANDWHQSAEWPMKRAAYTKFYLHSAGNANSVLGDGKLDTTGPAAEPTDTFISDPNNPVPSYGGNVVRWPRARFEGPRDQRAIQMRDDVLVYTGNVIKDDLQVTGALVVRLYASSSARDTDFTAKLVDLHADGYAQILEEGLIRARYRESFKSQKLIAPARVYEYTIDLWSVSHLFKKGHRIQIEIASSDFPKYDRNPNTGDTFGANTKIQRATQIIYHDTEHPSCITLPIVSNTSGPVTGPGR